MAKYYHESTDSKKVLEENEYKCSCQGYWRQEAIDEDGTLAKLTTEQKDERLENANDLEIGFLITNLYKGKWIYAEVVACSEDRTDIEIRTDRRTPRYGTEKWRKYAITLEDQFVTYENWYDEMIERLEELAEEAKSLSITD